MSGSDRIYRITSIGRPIDPRVPTNRAILVLTALGGLSYAAIGFSAAAPPAAVATDALTGLLVVFGAWALTRELAPDHDPAAFVATLFAFTALVAYRDVSLLLLFTTLFLVRIVNRSTGLAPRLHDSLLVLALSLVSAWSLSMPLIAIAAATAFTLDARLAGGQARQLGFAVAAVSGFGVLLVTPDGLSLTIALNVDGTGVVLLVVAAAYILAIRRTGPVRSVADATGSTLDTERVRAGMAVGLLAPLLAYLSVPGGRGFMPLGWSCLAAVAVSLLISPLARGKSGTGRQEDSD